MMIYDCFYITLATLIEPEHYKEEFKDARKILKLLESIFPELDNEDWKEYILASYELHREHLSIKGRIDYIKGIIFSESYADRINDITEERKKRILDYRCICGKKPSKHINLALSEFIYQQFVDQIEKDTKILLYMPPITNIPQ